MSTKNALSTIMGYFSRDKPYKVILSSAKAESNYVTPFDVSLRDLAGPSFKPREVSFNSKEELADYLQQFENPEKKYLGAYFPVAREQKDENTVAIGFGLIKKDDIFSYRVLYKGN